jgi:TorA maturation chaperone TorD
MVESRVEMLRQYAQGCDFFASLLLDLPDEAFVEKMIKSGTTTKHESLFSDDMNDSDKGVLLVDTYIQSCRGKATQEILQEVAVDRTRLLCGLTVNGPRPPYESLYAGVTGNEAALSIAASYRAGKCRIAEHIKNAPDHLGVELSFIADLCAREADALECGDEGATKETRDISAAFMADHLGCWATSFGDEMISFSTTDFYRGVGHLLKSFISEGKTLLVAC